VSHNPPTVSIVVPTYNGGHRLGRTLEDLSAQTYPAQSYELVVVIDGSTDGTAAMVRGLVPRCGLRVVEQTNRGLGPARNSGARAAQGDLIVFVDDDIRCPATLVSEHVIAQRYFECGVVLGPTLVAPESPASLFNELDGPWLQQRFLRISRNPQPVWPWDFFVGHNTSIARSLFLAHGGYDEDFRKLEEYELGLRLRKAGVNFRWHAAARTYHVSAKTVRQRLSEHAGVFGKFQIKLCRKHPAFRPYGELARVADGGMAKRAVRQAGIRSPISPRSLLVAPLAAVERGFWPGRLKNAATGLFGAGFTVLVCRGALEEAGSWQALRNEFGMRLPVLAYHHVGPAVANTYPGLTISPRAFERQIRWLAQRGYCAIRPSDWLAWRNEGMRLPSKPILITFDDGYADSAEYAFPILKRYGFTAAIYVVTGQIGATNAWDELQGYGTLNLMTAGEIRRWADAGMEIGAHSRTHPDLTALSREKLEDEITGSAEDLQRIVGVRPLSFAYPYGLYNAAVQRAVSSRFALGLTCDEGINALATDPFQLRRSEVASTDLWAEFKLRVRLGWLPARRFSRYLPNNGYAHALRRGALALLRSRTSQ
jgi:peptidoglycan/xylan/chitin deacetylase (PgdA/CDA1 family)/GT2 family glycosyltransferase